MPLWDLLVRTCRSWRNKRPARQEEHSRTESRPSRPAPLRIESLEDRKLLSAGTGLTAQYYGNMALTNLLMMRTDSTVDLNLKPGQAPAAGLSSTHYSVRWTGQVLAQFSENYTFSTESDDGVRLIVNGKTIINDWSDHSARQDSATIALKAGQKYSIEMDYYQDGGSAVAELMWSSPHTAKEVIPTADLFAATPEGAGTGLTGTYYKNTNLSGVPAVTQTASQIDFSSANGAAPVAGLPNTNWSARWTGTIQPQYSGTYTFYTTSDGGVRLFVNGKEIINNWFVHASTENSGSIALVAGQQYSIEVDYYHAAGGATAQLRWSGPSTPKQLIPRSALYPTESAVVRAVDAGGPAAGDFQADTGFSGGKTYSTSAAINTSAVTDPAPQAVYQTERYGNFTYTATGLTPGTSYTVRLDFDEIYWSSAGQRLFNVTINGTRVLTNFDIFAHAGGKNKAIVETFTVTADAGGKITIGFVSVKDNAKVNGIEILAGGGPISGSNPSPPSPPPSDWFSQNLHDPTLLSLARNLYNSSGKELTYNDMLSIFSTVEKAGSVTATELTDLRTLVANGSTLGMPADVHDLASNVVDGNPANATYQGQSLGDLAVGSTAARLQDLVNKWFLGLDTPAVPAGINYAYASGSLFGSGGPSYTDVVQGAVGDCYFLAALAEEAIHSPGTIESMFINNGNGTYTLRFYDEGVADYVTVDSDLPSSNGSFYYANAGAALNSSSNVLWVALAEKAYAQLTEQGWSRPTAVNAYSAIDLGWEGYAVNQLTGRAETSQSLYNNTATFSAIVGGYNAGQWIALDSNTSTAPGIVANHVYVMLGYDSASNLFNLYNPWGYVQQLSWAQITANFSFWSQNTT